MQPAATGVNGTVLSLSFTQRVRVEREKCVSELLHCWVLAWVMLQLLQLQVVGESFTHSLTHY